MKRTFLLLVIISLLFLNGCTKFADGPTISFRSEEQRAQGIWVMDKYLVNNIDSTAYYNNYFGGQCVFMFTLGDYSSSYGYEFSGNWGYDSIKSYHAEESYLVASTFMEINNRAIAKVGFVSAISDANNYLYTILKLDYRQMWLKTTDYGNTYELHLTNTYKYPKD